MKKDSGFGVQLLLIVIALIAITRGAQPTVVIALFVTSIVGTGLLANKRQTGKFFGNGAWYFTPMLIVICASMVLCVQFPFLILFIAPPVLIGSLALFWLFGRSQTKAYWRCVGLWHQLGNTGRAPAAFSSSWEKTAREELAHRAVR